MNRIFESIDPELFEYEHRGVRFKCTKLAIDDIRKNGFMILDIVENAINTMLDIDRLQVGDFSVKVLIGRVQTNTSYLWKIEVKRI